MLIRNTGNYWAYRIGCSRGHYSSNTSTDMSMSMKEQQQPAQEKKVGHLKKFVDYIPEKAQKLFDML